MARPRQNDRYTAPSATAADRRPRPEPDEALAAGLGEALRRVALGLTAALIVARAYWPGEGVRNEEDSGAGLAWSLAVLLTAGLAALAALAGGRTRLRWSWADAAFYLLILLVGLSASRGAERRVAINLAWEWAGLGVAYFLVRNLPRTRGESSALAGALMATAVAVAAYGLYQNAVELPATRAFYLSHRAEILARQGLAPGSTGQRNFEARLLDSSEPNATFALANSLAGFLVGPAILGLAVGLEALRRRDGRAYLALLPGALPWLTIMACLLLTKSRSGYLGLVVAALVLAWQVRRRVPARALAGLGVVLVGVVGAMVAYGLATRKLDREILIESTKSFRYRWEYWQGAWDVITREPGAWWGGVGPGNFGEAYLPYKRAWASEEIADPHNLLLEAWAMAGLGAAVALALAIVLGLREAFGPPRGAPGPAEIEPGPAKDGPPGRARWLVACAAGGWLLAWPLGGLNPFREDTADLFARWAILGLAWPWAVMLGAPLWRRVAVPAAGLGAAALAIAINLLAAGGLGFAPVALGLWTAIALGQNLRDDRPSGRLRDAGGRGAAFGLAAVAAALIGSFAGAIGPAWQADADLAEAILDPRSLKDPASAQRAFAGAIEAAERAMEADRYAARPYLTLAELEYQGWQSRGALPEDAVWFRIDTALLKAASPPRNRDSLLVRRREATYAREFLSRHGSRLRRRDRDWLRARVADALKHSIPLYPTSALLRAEYAEALAELDRFPEAAAEGAEALRLDEVARRAEHFDKRMPKPIRERLQEELPRWQRAPRPPGRP